LPRRAAPERSDGVTTSRLDLYAHRHPPLLPGRRRIWDRFGLLRSISRDWPGWLCYPDPCEFLAVAPQLFGPLPLLIYVSPDLGYIMLVSGVIALVWSVLRTGLAYWVLRRPGAPIAVEAPAA